MRFMSFTILGMSLIAGLSLPAPASACGPDSDCMIGERHYRIRMPDRHDGKTPVGAIIYAHGYKGSAKGAMRNEAVGQAVSDLGLAFVAVKSATDDWHIPNAPSQHPPEDLVELAYFDALVDDLKDRFNIDTAKLMVTGFSAGGMMTWTLACERAEKFAGFAPISGTFWDPHPKDCPSEPAHIIHFHGTADPVVPLKGRKIGPTHQGNIFDVLTMYADDGGYDGLQTSKPLNLSCERRTNPTGKILEFCLHDGGHQFRTDYIVWAFRELEALGAFEGATN
ncbi:MAG: alpha/beta hydrolase-fold protein [Pseudomonadota bacterium]